MTKHEFLTSVKTETRYDLSADKMITRSSIWCPDINLVIYISHSPKNEDLIVDLLYDHYLVKANSDAGKWLAKLRNGEIEAPDCDSISFDDNSIASWNGMSWSLGETI